MSVAVAPVARPAAAVGLSNRWFYFMTAVVVIQGGHMGEHVIQLLQVSSSACRTRRRSGCSAT
jgi:hypothetical protein